MWHFCSVEVTGKALNTRDGKGMKVPCKLNCRENTKIMKILKNFIYKLYFLEKYTVVRVNKCVDLWKTLNN